MMDEEVVCLKNYCCLYQGGLPNNCVQSMSRRRNCWDNAVTESFFHTLKVHVVHGSVFATRKEANAVLFDYIEIYYNRIRRHSANGWLSPEAFEQKYFKNLEGFVVHDTVQDHQKHLNQQNPVKVQQLSDQERIKQLERENKELQRANEILRKAAAFFAQAELDRPYK